MTQNVLAIDGLSDSSTPVTTVTEDGQLIGLSEQEVIIRRERGDGNNVHIQTGRTYQQILKQNFITFINIALFVIGLVMILFGLWGDAFVSVGVIALNIIVSVVQEFRAKRKLDKIALLTRPQSTVIREGQEKIVDPSELVLGDIIVAKPGDQIVVDGAVVGEGRIDVDESLLTGESDLVPKTNGNEVLSGSFCVTGSVAYEAQKVGADSFINKLTVSAKQFKSVRTPLQQDINFVVRILLMIATLIGLIFALSFVIRDVSVIQTVQTAAVIAGLVPAGLVLMTATAYAMGALRMSGRGALIQQSNAVESMSNVNVLCLDKTGTLTANRILLHAVHPLVDDETTFKNILGDYARTTRAGNRTSDALLEGCDGAERRILDEVPFSSARKWSALSFDDQNRRGVYVLGAPEMLTPYLPTDAHIAQDQMDAWANQGLRVLLVAYSSDVSGLHDANEDPQLPDTLKPYGVVSFSDELRPEAKETLAGFMEAGIELKIISGDNPHTVAALAKQAGLSAELQAISGIELANMSEAQFIETAQDSTVFGRITPEQKEKLVDTLRAKGNYVAMIGDGVNDVLSLKKAQIGIAMQSGSAATRGVADIVLLNDSFAALPAAFMEGQRILNGMSDIIRLFLTRAFYAALIIIGTAVVVDVELFPFIPKHASLITLLSIGFPTFGIAAWARAGVPKTNQVKSSMRFVFPAALTMAFVAILIYMFYIMTQYLPVVEGIDPIADLTNASVESFVAEELDAISLSRTVMTTALIFMGLVLILFVEPPTRFWVGGDDFSGDWRPTLAAFAMLITYFIIMAVTPFREFFELSPLRPIDWIFTTIVTLLWTACIWWIWRNNIFERFFGFHIAHNK